MPYPNYYRIRHVDRCDESRKVKKGERETKKAQTDKKTEVNSWNLEQ